MQTEEKLYQYLEESGCIRRVLVVLVDTSASFDCGPSGRKPDGTIVLGGYEVQAQARSITPMAETWPLELCFQTASADDALAMLGLFTPGCILRVESNCWSLSDGEYTFYVENLAAVEQVPNPISQAFWSIFALGRIRHDGE